MAVRIGMNGFGRIGRYLTRLLARETDLELAVINARADNHDLAHLFKYDSTFGQFPGEVSHYEDGIVVNGRKIPVTRDAKNEWQWKKFNIDIAMETTGTIKDRDGLAKHLDCGAKKAIISAPAKKVDVTVVPGVNDKDYDPAKHNLISSASCTTNCLAPVAKLINDRYGIKSGFMTTVHSYTMSQRILDGSHKDLRRGRSAAENIIPTSTGAAKALGLVIPELDGKLEAMALRVPTPDVSLIDLVCELEKATTKEEVNQMFKEACQGPLKENLGYTDEPLVSRDFLGSTYGGVIAAQLTSVLRGAQL